MNKVTLAYGTSAADGLLKSEGPYRINSTSPSLPLFSSDSQYEIEQGPDGFITNDLAPDSDQEAPPEE
jgi:hypothetical protein